jgi:integrase/recombinase XerD
VSTIEQHVAEYLRIRRALGFKLMDHELVLRDLAGWLGGQDATVVTSELLLEWAQRIATSSPVWQRQRLTIARGFAEYLSTIDTRTEVPATDLLPAVYNRTAPYIYSTAEIAALMETARSLTPPLKAATYESLIGLLACTGIRFGEASGLDCDDVNLAGASLLVRSGKNGRSRHVPVHATTVAALSAYAERRDRFCPRPTTPSFFVGTSGGRLAQSSAHAAFATLRRLNGLDRQHHGRSPRFHDLRHTFVVRTMMTWYHDGVDVQARLPTLSTYLGHVDPKSTYWYQQAVPELMSLVVRRLEREPGDER